MWLMPRGAWHRRSVTPKPPRAFSTSLKRGLSLCSMSPFLEGPRVRGEGRPGALLVLWGGYAPVVSSFVVLALCPLRLFSLVGLRWTGATASPFVVPLAIILLFYRASALSRGVSHLKLEMGDTAARKLMGSCISLHSSLDCRLRARARQQ